MLPLLAQDPAHGVGHVRLAAPVRTDDPSDSRLEGEDGAVEEAFETLDFEAGQSRSAKKGLIVGHRGGAPGNDTVLALDVPVRHRSDGTIARRDRTTSPADPTWRRRASDRDPNREPWRPAWHSAGTPA